MSSSFSNSAKVVLTLAILALGGPLVHSEPVSRCGLFRNVGEGPTDMSGAWKRTTAAGYFVIHYRSGDSIFSDSDRDGTPEVLKRHLKMIVRSRHFLETQLGWKLPATRREWNRPEIDVYLVRASRDFHGTVLADPSLRIILNRDVLSSADFALLWMHQFAHAAELEYKPDGDYWFYEATAGWMEGQFDRYSTDAGKARSRVRNHPEISLTDSSPVAALGASRFLDLLGRPHRDVVRQIWERWSYSESAELMQVIRDVLAVNHLPELDSYLQSYFLGSLPTVIINDNITNIVLSPYSAVSAQEWAGDIALGGVHLTFRTSEPGDFIPAILFYSSEQSEGTISLKKRQNKPWSAIVPFAGMERYRVIIVNPGPSELYGTIHRTYDSTIPVVLEYFRASASETGVQLEWKTSRENGVAFWNLYRILEGKRELLNYFPIPATIQSQDGIRYVFFDSSGSGYYTLEAITVDGFPGQAGGAEKDE